jgi:hypothetical protein
MGPTTQRFFIEGETHEANNYEDVVLEPDDEPAKKVEFDSFDKVPRKRSPALVLFSLGLVAGIGVVGWKSAGVIRDSSWVKTATRAMVRPEAQSAAAPAPRAAPVAAQAAPAPVPTPAPAPIQVAVAAPPPREAAPAPAAPEPAPRATTAPSPKPAATAMPTPATTEAAPKQTAAAQAKARVSKVRAARSDARSKSRRPLRGYAWSASAGAMVPVNRAASEAAPSREAESERDARSTRGVPLLE